MLRLSLVALVSLSAAAPAKEFDCTVQFPMDGPPVASFDLTPLKRLAGQPYSTRDTYYNASSPRPFHYLFNVCENIEKPDVPAICDKKSQGDSPAYQLRKKTTAEPEGACLKLGTLKSHFEMIDGDNSLVGLRLVYEGGDKCHGHDGIAAKDRKFEINFWCSGGKSTLPEIGTVTEQDCEYSVDFETIHACPVECHGTQHDALCNGHGLCALDSGSGKARCFCNAGRTGADCEKTMKIPNLTPSSPNGALTAVVVTMLVILIAIGAVLYVRIKHLNSEDNPYGAFEDQQPETAASGL